MLDCSHHHRRLLHLHWFHLIAELYDDVFVLFLVSVFEKKKFKNYLTQTK